MSLLTRNFNRFKQKNNTNDSGNPRPSPGSPAVEEPDTAVPKDLVRCLEALKACWEPHNQRVQDFDRFMLSLEAQFNANLDIRKRKFQDLASQYNARARELQVSMRDTHRWAEQNRMSYFQNDYTTWEREVKKAKEVHEEYIRDSRQSLSDGYKMLAREADSAFQTLRVEQDKLLGNLEQRVSERLRNSVGFMTRISSALSAFYARNGPCSHSRLGVSSQATNCHPTMASGASEEDLSEPLISEPDRELVGDSESISITPRPQESISSGDVAPLPQNCPQNPSQNLPASINSASPIPSDPAEASLVNLLSYSETTFDFDQAFSLLVGHDQGASSRCYFRPDQVMSIYQSDESQRNESRTNMTAFFDRFKEECIARFTRALERWMAERLFFASRLDPLPTSELVRREADYYENSFNLLIHGIKSRLTIMEEREAKYEGILSKSIKELILSLKSRLEKEREDRLKTLNAQISHIAELNGWSSWSSFYNQRQLDGPPKVDILQAPPSSSNWLDGTVWVLAGVVIFFAGTYMPPVAHFSPQDLFSGESLLKAYLPLPAALSRQSLQSNSVDHFVSVVQDASRVNELRRQCVFEEDQRVRKEEFVRLEVELESQFQGVMTKWAKNIAEQQVDVDIRSREDEERKEAAFSAGQVKRNSTFLQTLEGTKASVLAATEQRMARIDEQRNELGKAQTKAKESLMTDMETFERWFEAELAAAIASS